jgi:hypothetical protein
MQAMVTIANIELRMRDLRFVAPDVDTRRDAATFLIEAIRTNSK